MHRRPRTSNERGVVLIWMAFMLIVFLMFTALGVDGAKLAATRTQLHNAADAAALAGASAIDSTTGTLVQDIATARALAAAARNEAFLDAPDAVLAEDLEITFPEPTVIQVVAKRVDDRRVWAHVAQVIGRGRNEMQALAQARVMPASGICERLVPMGAIPPAGEDFVTDCSREYELKVGSQGNYNGNFLLLRFPDCFQGPCGDMNGPGANTMGCLVENGYSCCIEEGEVIDTQPGNDTGPFKDGLNDRFDLDTDRTEDICYEDYRGNGQRVVFVPRITPPGNGMSQVTVTGFTAFFLKRRVTGGGLNCEVHAQFVYDIAPGTSGDSNDEGTLFTIRLVK
jgi:hypothetical protein